MAMRELKTNGWAPQSKSGNKAFRNTVPDGGFILSLEHNIRRFSMR